MNVEWFTNEKEKVATIYETNITFNTVAANHFKDSYSTLVGFDIENKVLLIKPITKDEARTRNLSEDEMHTMSIKPSYGRINGKNIYIFLLILLLVNPISTCVNGVMKITY